MWTRNTKDPLIKFFVDHYKINLLSRPRENVFVYDVVTAPEKGNTFIGPLDGFLGAKLDLPLVSTNEKVAAISEKTSELFSGAAEVSFLGAFLNALGARKLALAISGKKGTAFRINISNPTRDAVTDVYSLSRKLREFKVPDETAFPSNARFYIVTAVHKTDSLSIAIENELENESGLSGGKEDTADVKITASKKKAGYRTIRNAKRILAYGIELMELTYQKKKQCFDLAATTNYLQFAAADTELPRSLLFNDEQTVLIDIESDDDGLT